MERPLVETIWRTASAGKEALLDLVLPPACRFCNQAVPDGEDFCHPCHRSLTITETMMGTACTQCGFPIARVAGRTASEETSGNADSSDPTLRRLGPCVRCRDSDFDFDEIVPMWAYQDAVCDAVVAAKYASQAPLGDALGRRLGRRVAEHFRGDLPDLVTFVPSHVSRQFRRGGNGNEVLAAAVAAAIGRRSRVLMKTTRQIAKQAWLSDAQRIENVRGAFTMKRSYALTGSARIAQRRHVLVVDDVLTTGATANEVARVLRNNGVERVSIAVVARAIRTH